MSFLKNLSFAAAMTVAASVAGALITSGYAIVEEE